MFALATESPPLLAVLIVIAIFFALVNVISLILAAKAVDQVSRALPTYKPTNLHRRGASLMMTSGLSPCRAVPRDAHVTWLSPPPQAVFVPVQTCATLLVNMATGLLVWEDWQASICIYIYVPCHVYIMHMPHEACPHSLVLASYSVLLTCQLTILYLAGHHGVGRVYLRASHHAARDLPPRA